MDKFTFDDLINQILHMSRKTRTSAKEGHVYSDEPIIRRASEIKNENVPGKIREMRNIARSRDAYWRTSAWLFYQQGTYMEDYTDNYDYNGNPPIFMPTYSEMNTEQLRGYFSWRTHFRNGELPPAPTPFLQLYAQEIINQIGISSAEEGFELLTKLYETYRGQSDYLEKWISDYAVYYGLPEEYYSRCSEFESDRHIIAFANCDETDDDSLYEAVCALSSYRVKSSRFCREYPLEYKKAIVRIIRSLSSFQNKHRKKNLCEALFGKRCDFYNRIFEYAAFYEKGKNKVIKIKVNPVRSYCYGGGSSWICSKYENTGTSKKLSLIAKETDRLMREAFDYKFKLKEENVPKSTVSLIKKEIEEIAEERKRAAAGKKAHEIVIDLSQLSRIRSDADIVRDKLIVEDDGEFAEPAAGITETALEPPVETPDEKSGCLLTAAEKGFIEALLSGSDIRAYAGKAGVLPSVLGDGINEKLFDIFSDNVIDFTDDRPCILDDYIDDIKQMNENGEL